MGSSNAVPHSSYLSSNKLTDGGVSTYQSERHGSPRLHVLEMPWEATSVRSFLQMAVLLFTHICCFAQDAKLPCVVEFVGYDGSGHQLSDVVVSEPASIERSATIYESRKGVPLPTAQARVQGSRLLFSPTLLGSLISIRVGEYTGGGYRRAVYLAACNQRETVFLRSLDDQDIDATYSQLVGRLDGCKDYEGDWWVRVQPLFGEDGGIHESRVDSETGAFVIVALGRVRQLIVAGRADQPLKAFAVDLDPNESAGSTYSMGGSCPEGSAE